MAIKDHHESPRNGKWVTLLVIYNSFSELEHGPVEKVDDYPWKMVIFHSYVIVTSRFFMGKSTISLAIFNSKLLVITRG